LGISCVSCAAYHDFSSHTNPSWIVDSGATNHIASSLTLFQIYHKINLVQINLPNGSSVTSFSGIVQFSPSFVTHDVFYVPDFNFNLLSISKLIYNHCYKIVFFW